MNDQIKTGEYTTVNKNYQAPVNPRVAAINSEIAAQGNKGYSVAPTAIETPAKTPTGQTAPTLPEPTAPTIQENYITSLTEQQKIARKTLEDTYKTQKADVDKQLEEAKVAREGYIANTDPTTRPTYEQETRVMQNQLDAAEASSKTIQKNFEDNQKLVDELDKLLTEGNQYIESQKGPGSVPLSVASLRTNRAIQEVSARAGVIEAVMSARNSQISQAHNIINQGRDAVKANWNDSLQYYGTLLEYNEKDIINLDAESKEIAQKEIALIENDLAKVDATAAYLQELMIDPRSAQFIAESGVKLTDSVEQINTKMAAQSRRQKLQDFQEDMALKGYEYVPFPATDDDVQYFSVGGQKMAFKAPKGGGNINQLTDNERALMTQFKGEPIVKDYNTILAKKLSVDRIIESGVGGPGDLALVYEFMKALDPTSVVRETEYASAAKSGNIFAGVFARFNGYLKEKGGFLPTQVQSAFQSIVDSKLAVQQQLYDNVASEYKAIAERQGLNPSNVLVNYSAVAPQSKTSTSDDIYEVEENGSKVQYQKAADGLYYPVGSPELNQSKSKVPLVVPLSSFSNYESPFNGLTGSIWQD